MTLVYPEATPSLGNTRVKAILAIPTLTAPRLALDINAASSIELSAHLYPPGWTPGGTTARGTKPPRLSSRTIVEQLNRTTYTIGDLQYVYNPQANDAAAGNEAKQLLVDKWKGYLLERIGPDADTSAWAVGQHTRAHYVQVGPQIPSGDRTDENGEFFITQAVIYVLGTAPTAGVIVA